MGACQNKPTDNDRKDTVEDHEVGVDNTYTTNKQLNERNKAKYARGSDITLDKPVLDEAFDSDQAKDANSRLWQQRADKNFPAKKIMTLIEKKALDDSNVPSPYKASPGLKDKTSLEKETEVQRSNFGKEETKAKVNEQKNNKNVSAKSAASKKRKEQLQKSQKQQTLISKIIYSNNDLMKIDEILQQELMNNNDPNQIIFEGNLLKYKPGASFNWIDRWVRVTRTEFMYYKNQWTASCKDLRPLIIIPLRQLVAVFRVNLDLPELHSYSKWAKQLSSVQKKYSELYQLEIFSEQSEYPYKDEFYDMNEDSENKMKEEQEEKIQGAQNIDLDQMEGYRLWNEYQERKLHESPENARKKGYLMRPPHRYRQPRSSVKRDSASKQIRGMSDDGVLNTSMGKSSPLRGRLASQEIALSLDTISKKKYAKMNPRNEKKLGQAKRGAVYKWIKETQMLTSWSGREREWFYSEKRLLFATPSEKEREIWVSILNWIFNYAVKEEEERLNLYSAEEQIQTAP